MAAIPNLLPKRSKPMTKTHDLRSHFGFLKTPFTREIDIRDRWADGQYEAAVEALRDTVEKRHCAALIAPAGCGKTMVLRALVDRLSEARFRTHYVKVTDLSKRDFCRELCQATGAKTAATYGSLVRRLQERMESLVDSDSLRPVLVIDEAHDMRPDVLAILRVLTNFEMDSRLVISIILCGQPPLRRLLRRGDMEAVSRRIAYYATLQILTRAQVPDYVRHRLFVAGSDRDAFAETALDAVFEASQGNLRAIDRLCLRSLEVACKDKAAHVTADHVIEARKTVWP